MTTAYVTHAHYVGHDMPGHPEHAGRIKAVWQQLDQTGLTGRMKKLKPEPATDAQILFVHKADYLEALKQIAYMDHGIRFDSDTYATPDSPHIARLSAGGVLLAVDEVLTGAADNALAAVRPPGHHAIPQRGMGFCLLGNIAMAARHAQQAHGIERVMIIDFDVHHGNGTQDMFYDDDSVLFVSTHQYPFYPGTGMLSETGKAKGRGYTMNIPLTAGHGDGNYNRIFKEVIWPAARRFNPGLILVSAGFDAHWVDPLAMMNLSLLGYANLTRELIHMAQVLCDGRVVFVMEGGYDLNALGHGWRNIAYALLGEDHVSDPLGTSDAKEPEIDILIDRLQEVHNL